MTTFDVLYIKSEVRGRYCQTNTNGYGFPISYLPRQKQFFGFQTGDIIKADVPKGKNQGVWYGGLFAEKQDFLVLRQNLD